MNTDHAFYIGNTHSICQDYAISSVVDGGAFAIVSDGCSGSPDVDFGARALALSAKRTLAVGGVDLTPSLFGKVTIDNLRHIGDNFPLDPKSLDATLLVAWVIGHQFKVHMFGDGVFFHKTATTLRLVHVDFESNTPAYLSYYLDKIRLKNYEEQVVGSKRIVDTSIYLPGENVAENTIQTEDYIKPFDDVSFTGIVEPGDIIGVCSDGVNSFRKGDGSDIKWENQIQEFIDFKSTAGVFVQRRIGFMKRQWTKQLTSHYDDISVAAIVI